MSLIDNQSFGPFVCTTKNTKLFDLRSYAIKPLCGHALQSLSSFISKIHNLEDFYDLLSPKEAEHFDKIFINTHRFEFIMNLIQIESFHCNESLPIIELPLKKLESLLELGLYVDQSNFYDRSLFLYLPLSITNLDLYDLISRIKRV